MSTSDAPTPFSERPIVRFLTLRYTMGPIQFLIMRFFSYPITGVIGYGIMAVFAIIVYFNNRLLPGLIPDGYDNILLASILCILWLWVDMCFSSARLLDAKIHRSLIFFTSVIPCSILFCLLFFQQAFSVFTPDPEDEWMFGLPCLGSILLSYLFLLFAPSRLYSDMTAEDRAKKLEEQRLKTAN